jgi:hypothetical protein
MRWIFRSNAQIGQTYMPEKGGETLMPWMWMPFGFYPQSKKRRGNYVKKGNASFVKNKATLHRTAPKRDKAPTRS